MIIYLCEYMIQIYIYISGVFCARIKIKTPSFTAPFQIERSMGEKENHGPS